jgi:hypothetical protein
MSYHGLGNPSQSVDGLGNPSQSVDGLGAAKLDCPFTTGSAQPAGLSDQFKASYGSGGAKRTICNTGSGDSVAKLCNMSAYPTPCYYAKMNKVPGTPLTSYLGRAATQKDWDLWVDWSPSSPTSEGTPGDSGNSDTLFYAGLAVAGLGVIGAVWYAFK